MTSAALFSKTLLLICKKAADKRPQQPELAENLCVICFSNALELWSSSFQSPNNMLFHVYKEVSYHR